MEDVLDIYTFKAIFSNRLFDLPIRWDGGDYLQTLKKVFKTYYGECLSKAQKNKALESLAPKIEKICKGIINAIGTFLNGKPSLAWKAFNDLFLSELMPDQVSFYNTLFNPYESDTSGEKKHFDFFRVRKVTENKIFERDDIFHTPFNLRNKVATTRYSIAGYPSLYLASSLKLSLKEMEYDIKPGRIICSRFELPDESKARIIELGIKPKDFFPEVKDKLSERYLLIDQRLLSNQESLKNYCLWFPVIAACSFMRTNRDDPFAVEYVLPQLLMQSVRSFQLKGVVVGVRYFSCSSVFASELGFNYVFPTKYTKIGLRFCERMSDVFHLTKPVFLNEYKDSDACESALRKMKPENVSTKGD